MGDNRASEYWFLFKQNKLLVKLVGGEPVIPDVTDIKCYGKTTAPYLIGNLNSVKCLAAEIMTEVSLQEGFEWRGLRQLFGQLEESAYQLAGRAFHILHWDKTSRHCGWCGTTTQTKADEIAKECPNCGLLIFPRLSPAVIVAVVNEDKILLARNKRFPGELYSVVAGFVEPGETLEECVHREVREEVGVEVKNIQYFASQPWPYPDSLMIAFTAEYAGGKISVDNIEVEAANWFSAQSLPRIPDKISIARRLIDWFCCCHNQPI